MSITEITINGTRYELKAIPDKSTVSVFNWVVFTEDGFGFDTWNKKDWRGDKGSNWDDSVKTFIAGADADEFILTHKPTLSIKDILSISQDDLYNSKIKKITEENLKLLVQTKLTK